MANIPGASFDEHLPPLHTDCSRFSPLSSDRECPSLSDGFSFSEMNDRRPSFTSSMIGDSPSWLSGKSSSGTTPTTPVTAMPPNIIFGNRKHTAPDTPYGFARNELEFFWEPEPQLPMSAAAILAVTEAETIGFGAEYPPYSQTMSLSNPSLSRPMFGYEGPISSGDGLGWPHHQLSSPQQTIAPSAAFQQHLLIGSPVLKQEPSTPCRRGITSSSFLGSSPLTLMSPPILPSQHETEPIKYEGINDEEPEWALLTSELSRRRGIDRLSRRSYDRKRSLGPSFKPKSVKLSDSGINCEVVIAQNEFACRYPGCIDKQTGKQKRFKRQEHKKRHEKTVREKNEHGLFKCWVKGCKTAPFTRTDNLKSHLKNTHGKKSPNQRNRYVATQDKNSMHYDPDWEGELDDEGYPIHPAT